MRYVVVYVSNEYVIKVCNLLVGRLCYGCDVMLWLFIKVRFLWLRGSILLSIS